MSNSVGTVKASLWREGFRLFRRHWGEWARYAVWFFVITALFQALFIMHLTDPAFAILMQRLAEMKKADEAMTPDMRMAGLKAVLGAVAWIIPVIFVGIVQNFVYRVFFMRQQPGIGSPKLGVGWFFYMIGIDILISLILALVMAVLVGIPMTAGFALAHSTPLAVPVAAIAGLIGFGVVVFISFRLALAPVLAVCAAKPVIKNSWRLMKGNCWRLFGNTILLFLVVLLFAIIAMIAEAGVGMALTAGTHALFAHIAPDVPLSTQSFLQRYMNPTPGSVDFQIKLYVQIVFDTLNICILSGIICAFSCAVVRVLYEEKRAADPAFSLLAS